jgi:hypothetical protein
VSPTTGKALLGMSSPAGVWAARVKDVGPGLQARRLFYTSFTASLSLAQTAVKDGMTPIMSWKVPGGDWAAMAAGKHDAELKTLATKLQALGHPLFVALHHEPADDGAAKDWAAMQVHCLPILKKGGANISVGVIGNGWWWSNQARGYSDSEIAAYITPAVKGVCDVVAADCYQLKAGDEESAPKMKNMVTWAKRTGGVKKLGVGEFNCQTAIGITNAVAALKDPMFAWGLLWNADLNTVTHLTGDRLAAFKKALAAW